MIELTRRGFIKLGASAAGLSIIGTKFYIETPQKDWVADNGDFYTVIIPDYKILSKEKFDKPVLLIMGNRSVAELCEFNGFVNLQSKSNHLAIFRGNLVDLMNFEAAEKSMGAVNIKGHNVFLQDSSIFTYGKVDYGVRFNTLDPLVMPPSGMYIHGDSV